VKVKKIAVILLLLIYGSATVGATAHLHYCMNEFVGWSLFHSKDDKCGKCGMEEKDNDGCCKDEHKHFKLKVDHQKADVGQYINLVTTPVLSIPVIDFSFQFSYNNNIGYPTCHAPPDTGEKRLYVLHCVFLI
jgi:hypothetical protein